LGTKGGEDKGQIVQYILSIFFKDFNLNAQKRSLSDALSSSSTKPNLFDVSYLLSSNFIIIIVHINILLFCLSC